MNQLHLPACFLALALLPGLALADTAATVTQAVNQVSHGSSTASATPAHVGTQLSDGDYLKTGASSRAEMELANHTITRLGANTVFNYSAATNQVDLQAGTVLFSKPKDGERLNIKTAAVTAAILGTTVFFQVHGDHYSFGVVEGTGHVTIGGVAFAVHAGELVEFTPGGSPHLVAFNVPRFVHTSPLFHKYTGTLPNQPYIDAEIEDYNALVREGFIIPGNDDLWNVDFNYPPGFPIQAFDSQGNAHYDLNHPAQPPPPPPHNCGYNYST